MPSFKQKNVIKSYKLRLQDKLKTVSGETENAISFLNNCLLEFKNRVDEILEIKDEKCLSLYRKLTKDLEDFSEKLFILQSLEECSEEESDNQNEENSELRPSTGLSNSATSSSQNVTTDFPASLLAEANIELEPEDNQENGSAAGDDFRSLPSDSVAQCIAGSSLLANIKLDRNNFETFHDKYGSTQSFSQSSCYRSVSSTISEPLTSSTVVDVTYSSDTKAVDSNALGSVKSEESLLQIPPPVIQIKSKISAMLSYIVDPGDFWIQMENSFGLSISYPKSEYNSLSCPSCIKKGSFCLAPFKSSPFYYRAQSLSSTEINDDFIKVRFIDHGSTQDILLRDLRHLPLTSYEFPAQAIHCYLYGIVPVDGSWSDECIKQFKGFQNFYVETVIQSKKSLYAVELVSKCSENLDDDFSVDIASSLCLDGFAILENEPVQQNLNLNAGSKIMSSEVSAPDDMTAISNDSGLSVTSAYKSSQNATNRNEDLGTISRDYVPAVPVNTSPDSCDKNFNFDSYTQNLISCESYDVLHFQNSNGVLKENDLTSNLACFICKRDEYCLHLKIPPPSLVFVEKDMMVVMLSHIVSPHEFYVNMAMENIVNLDELREQMTNTYDSQRKGLHHVNMEDLSENLYCAGYYEADKYWYRVKIIRINSQDREKRQALVQYIDYGNTATVKCSDLLPLTPEFSQHSTFAIKCSLAGILPVEESPMIGSVLSFWSADAISAFKQLTSFERCLTAQVCNELHNGDCYPVLLWDTQESNDLLINLALADLGYAKFDNSFLHTMPSEETSKSSENVDILSEWDPMQQEFNNIQNSYGVNDEDIQVVTSGYRAKDEEYVCHYYSLRGYCPRGTNCRYMHVPLLECGVTRDQEEVYCMDTLLLIPENTTNVLVQVSGIINPSHFYVVLPFGCKSVDEIDNLVKTGASYEDILNNEAKALFHDIDKHYNDSPFQENTSIALALGTIVVAKRSWDKQFHRGRVVDITDISGPSQIFFVDSGDTEWVPRKFIRTILPQYLYMPFQAIQCCLYRVKPITLEENKWSSDAVKFFKNSVEGETLLAEIVHRFDQVIHVDLRKTSQNNHQKLSDLLVSKGFAQVCSDVPAAKKESLYVPG